jgi:hypothetical protein
MKTFKIVSKNKELEKNDRRINFTFELVHQKQVEFWFVDFFLIDVDEEMMERVHLHPSSFF